MSSTRSRKCSVEPRRKKSERRISAQTDPGNLPPMKPTYKWRWRRAIGSLALAVLFPFSGPRTPGRFAMTGAVRKFNLDTAESQWGREILFLALYVVPVYPFCALADLMVVNSIEFWTETNPWDGEKAITLTGAEPWMPEEAPLVARPAEPSVKVTA